MSKLLQNNAFKLGFWIGIFLFLLLNFLSAIIAETPQRGAIKFGDGFTTYGFPFPIYVYGGYPPVYEFVWIGITINIAIAVVISFALGFIFKFIQSKMSSRRVILK